MLQSPATDGVQPLLLMLKGHPGAGKSTLARSLASHLKLPLVDKDDARGVLTAGLATAALDDALLNTLSYQIMFQTAAMQLRCGNSCIVDCPLARQELWSEACKVARVRGAAVALVEVEAPPESIWRARIEARSANVAAGGLDSHKPSWDALQKLVAGYRGCHTWSTALPGSSRLLVPAQMPAPAAAQTVLQWLAQHGLIDTQVAAQPAEDKSAADTALSPQAGPVL